MSSEEYSSSSSDGLYDESYEKVGSLINKKYILLHKLGYGSFASVWLTYHIPSRKFYAIKIQYADDFETAESEVTLLKNLRGSGCKQLCTLVESFTYDAEDGAHMCMVFELAAGSMYDLIKSKKYHRGLPFDTCIRTIHQVLTAMDVLNNKYHTLHTDIKPENVLIVGQSKKVQEIITEFNSLNFDHTCQTIQKNIKGKKFKGNRGELIYNVAIEQMLSKMKTIEREESDSESDKTESESLDEESSWSEESYDEDFEIDPTYVENIKVQLADFGNCCNIDDKTWEIQTRYYRAPEVLLEYPFNETCDVWSVGCMFYELLTGEVLFDPEKKKRVSRDRFHVYEFQRRLGRVPDELLQKSRRKRIYFKNNGLMKGINKIDYQPLHLLIMKKLKDRQDISKEQMNNIIDFLYQCFQYDPIRRLSVRNSFKHPLFRDIVPQQQLSSAPKIRRKSHR